MVETSYEVIDVLKVKFDQDKGVLSFKTFEQNQNFVRLLQFFTVSIDNTFLYNFLLFNSLFGQILNHEK